MLNRLTFLAHGRLSTVDFDRNVNTGTRRNAPKKAECHHGDEIREFNGIIDATASSPHPLNLEYALPIKH
jgi:hypothetical protein